MTAAKKVILLLWLLVLSLANASAFAPLSPENRVWKNLGAPPQTRPATAAQLAQPHQENAFAAYDFALESLLAAKTAGGYSDDILRAAQKEFPGKAGKIELHHIEPKYLGGSPTGPLAPLDAAYHQQITNEFRRLVPYGQRDPLSPAEVQQIMQKVYEKYPLPGN